MAAGGGGAFSEDVVRLFTSVLPGIGSSSQAPASESGASYTAEASGFVGHPNTLDEPVWDTIKRDLLRIRENLVLVVFPFSNRDQQSAALRNWDLWGPMFFTLVLAITLSVGSPKAENTFSVVFAIISFGAVVLTFNVVLLGGNIGFFQSLCLLGYCLFPIDVAAIVCAAVSNMIVRWVVTMVMVAWAAWASVPFIGGSVSPARRALAVYPLLLLYLTVSWLALIKG